MSCSCVPGPVAGNDVYYIANKVGAPLSTACERAVGIGAIPEVIRYAGFTLVGGTAVAGSISNAGIVNPTSFFKSRQGCYYSQNGRLAGSTCA